MKDITDISHDLAMAAMFRDDADFAAYFLCDVLADGDEVDLALLLPQLEDAFDAVWALVPDLAGRLREFFSGSDRLHWAPDAVDGWYCVSVENGFDVYYQEHGRRERFIQFSTEKEAMAFVLKAVVARR